MRSVERSALALLVCAALGGCASVGSLLPGGREAAPSTAAAAVAAPTPAPAPARSEVPVPADASRAFEAAVAALKAGRTAEAQRGFEALARSHPELAGPQANLGLIHRRAGRAEEAVAALERAAQAGPEQADLHNELGIAYRGVGRFDAARSAYERAIALDARHADAHLNLAILLDLYLGQPAAALPLYERYQQLAAGPDALVGKWIADLKNRKPAATLVSKREPS
jgi:tetratricopeptide (TPR) repeat protein